MDEEQSLLVISGSRREPSRTRELARVTKEIGDEMGLSTDVLDLRKYPMELYDGRGRGEYDDVTNEAVTKFVEANSYLLATPIYFGGISGALKNLIDHTPYEIFLEEPRTAGLLATGRDKRHQHVIEAQLRPTLVYLGVDVTKTSAFATEADFDEFSVESQSIEERIELIVEEILELQ